MSKIDDFKLFVRSNPKIYKSVMNKKASWQELYELYDIYKEDSSVWNKYLKEEKNENRNFNINNILDYAKNIDVNKLQDGITSIQKAIDLFGGMLTKNGTNVENDNYRPRPVYRRFDD